MDYVSEIEPHLGRLIGVGGYGRVFEGVWRGQRVAVKLMACGDEAEYKVSCGVVGAAGHRLLQSPVL